MILSRRQLFVVAATALPALPLVWALDLPPAAPAEMLLQRRDGIGAWVDLPWEALRMGDVFRTAPPVEPRSWSRPWRACCDYVTDLGSGVGGVTAEELPS